MYREIRREARRFGAMVHLVRALISGIGKLPLKAKRGDLHLISSHLIATLSPKFNCSEQQTVSRLSCLLNRNRHRLRNYSQSDRNVYEYVNQPVHNLSFSPHIYMVWP